MKRREFLKTATGVGIAAIGLSGQIASGAKTAKRPNILFCIADDASYPHMSAYGCPWVKSPGFDRVAADGLLFTHAYTPNAKCAPSRACLLTGRNSWQLEEAANHVCFFPKKFKTYVEALGQQGYVTGYTGKGWSPGDAGRINGKPRQLCGPAWHKRKAKPPTRAMSGKDYASNFADFLAAKPENKPFCFWYGAHEPHRGYEYGSGVAKGKKAISDIKKVIPFYPDTETVRNDLLDYAFEIEHFDKHLQRILKTLEEAGELDNTLVVVTADNGMPFPRIKGQEYELSNHLPMAIMWKNRIAKPGRKIDDYVSFIDLAATYLDVAGVSEKTSGMKPIEGKSLRGIFESSKSGCVESTRDHVLIGKERHDAGRPNNGGYPIRGIVKGDMLYLINYEPTRWPAGNGETGYMNCDGSPTKTALLKMRGDKADDKYWQWSFGKRTSEEMYNVKKDPACMMNLVKDPKYKQLRDKLNAQLVAELKQQNDPRILGKGAVFDTYKFAHKHQQDYYERYMSGKASKAGWVNRSDYEPKPLD